MIKKIPYDKKKQAISRKHPPFYTTKDSFTKSQELFYCSKCGDTSFELIEDGLFTGKCCRCGVKFAS